MNSLVAFRDKNKKSGFTLIEMLLVSALTMTIGVFVFPLGISFYRVHMHNEAAEGLISVLRKSHSFAVSGRGGTAYGVRILDNGYVGFAGESYTARDQEEDEYYPVVSTITLSGIEEIVFEAYTGVPSDTGSVSIDSQDKHSEISISTQGLIN